MKELAYYAKTEQTCAMLMKMILSNKDNSVDGKRADVETVIATKFPHLTSHTKVKNCTVLQQAASYGDLETVKKLVKVMKAHKKK